MEKRTESNRQKKPPFWPCARQRLIRTDFVDPAGRQGAALHALFQAGFDEIVKVAVEHGLGVADLKIGA